MKWAFHLEMSIKGKTTFLDQSNHTSSNIQIPDTNHCQGRKGKANAHNNNIKHKWKACTCDTNSSDAERLRFVLRKDVLVYVFLAEFWYEVWAQNLQGLIAGDEFKNHVKIKWIFSGLCHCYLVRFSVLRLSHGQSKKWFHSCNLGAFKDKRRIRVWKAKAERQPWKT